MGVSVENEEGSGEVTAVSKDEGEASINNRKGKLIFFYEWNLQATWTGVSGRKGWQTKNCFGTYCLWRLLSAQKSMFPILEVLK